VSVSTIDVDVERLEAVVEHVFRFDHRNDPRVVDSCAGDSGFVADDAATGREIAFDVVASEIPLREFFCDAITDVARALTSAFRRGANHVGRRGLPQVVVVTQHADD
jgi:hypothetical protein